MSERKNPFSRNSPNRENYIFTSNQPKNVPSFSLKEVQEPYANIAPEYYQAYAENFVILAGPNPGPGRYPYVGDAWAGIA